MFHLAGETYGVAVDAIREIIGVSHLTKIPLAPACLRGVMNLRGAVVPVLDLAVRFGDSPTDLRKRTCVVILEIRKGDVSLPIGFIVDGVSEVRSAGAADLEPTPAFGTALRADFISGMLRQQSGFVPLLSLDAIFAEDELGELLETGTRVPSAPAAVPATIV